MSCLKGARRRVTRRKSAWNLLLIPAVLIPGGLFWWGSLIVANSIHGKLYPGQYLPGYDGAGAIMVSLAAFFAALPIAMIAGNLLVRLLPAARQMLDQEATDHPGTSFIDSQKDLIRLALYVIPASTMVWVAGVLLPWSVR